jgi:hypothetical protein
MSSFKTGLHVFALIVSMSGVGISSVTAGPCPKSELKQTAETCRQLAIKLDWLGRYQDRAACTANLDGSIVYFASNYILENQLAEAKISLNTAIVKTKYAADIGCYGQKDIQNMVSSLQDILNDIS